MSQAPSTFTPQTSFATLAKQPVTQSGLPGAQLDAEFARAAYSVNAAIARLSEIQQDDGAIRAGSVGISALSAEMLVLLAASGVTPREWVEGMAMKVGDFISNPKNTGANVYGTFTVGGLSVVFPYLPRNHYFDPEPFKRWHGDSQGGIFHAGISRDMANTRWTMYRDGGNWSAAIGDEEWPDLADWTNSAQEGTTGDPVVVTNLATPGSYLCMVDHVAGDDFRNDLDKWALVAAKAEAGDLYVDTFVGDGIEDNFALSAMPVDAANTQVFLDGIYQTKTAYAVNGLLLIFPAPPAAGVVIEAVTGVPVQKTVITVSDFSISTAKLATGAVTEPKMADSSVSARCFIAGSVLSAAIGAGAVTSEKLADGAVVASKIEDGAVTGAKLAPNSITGDKIQTYSITSEAIASGAITSDKLAAGPLSLKASPTTDLHATTMLWVKQYLLSASVITEPAIAASAVTNSKLATRSVTPTKIGGSGLPVQIQQVAQTAVQTVSASSWTDTGLTFSFTRINATSKVRVQAAIHGSASSLSNGLAFKIVRGSTDVGVTPENVGTRTKATACMTAVDAASVLCTTNIDFIDDVSAVATNPLVYKIQARISTGAGYINRSATNTDTAAYYQTISTMTLTELTT